MSKQKKSLADQLSRTKYFYKKLMKERDELKGHNKHIRQLLITLRRDEATRKEEMFELKMENDDLRDTKFKLEDRLKQSQQRYETMIHSIFDEPEPVDLTETCPPEPASPTPTVVVVKEKLTPKRKHGNHTNKSRARRKLRST